MKSWGGVAALFPTALNVKMILRLSSPDIMVLNVDHKFILINAYILPEASPWRYFTNIHPFQCLQETLSAVQTLYLPIILGGDLNGRTANCAALPHHPPQHSINHALTNSRGNRILALAADHDLCILNGVTSLGLSNSNWTSFQGKTDDERCSVIDYFLASSNSIHSLVSGFSIGAHERTWSDHAPLVLHLNLPTHVSAHSDCSATLCSDLFYTTDTLPTHSHLDCLLIDTIISKPDEEKAMQKLYGKVFTTQTNALRIFTDGSCFDNGTLRARAGAGVFAGHGSDLSCSARVVGDQTNNRSEVLAILIALSKVNQHRSLSIHTDSEYAIHSIAHWAIKNASTGWKCPNGDILKDIAAWLVYCTAPLFITHVKAHNGNTHNEMADQLAKEGAMQSISQSHYIPLLPPHKAQPTTTPLAISKVSTNLPEQPSEGEKETT
ncbi:hypothetical protein D9758_018674 [Tetrapyrgos nigripes]|uniref:ribonuclease H n=1 Tax=Tetrapyrgos nigripes TaxID=182062 RepID=A0A8H5B846_9AGAR|nr:hypothetical protein D9758_018674 [Tetrapyrgos nigripes]